MIAKTVTVRGGCFVCGNPLTRQRSTRRYCADRCRQSAYRRRRAPRVRHRRGASPIRVPHGLRQTTSLATAVVRPIPLREARQIIERYEPMCCTAGALPFGLYLGPALASVVVFGPPAEANLRPQHDSIVLRRGVTLPWAPRNCGSKLIRRAMDLLPDRYARVVAYSDATVGETGTIYRAVGFDEIGASQRGRRVLVHFQGKVLSERAARQRFGTSSTRKLAALGLKVETVPRRTRWQAVITEARSHRNVATRDEKGHAAGTAAGVNA